MGAKLSTRQKPSVIGIGVSAGGLTALKTILPALPRSYPASILIVQHILPKTPSRLDFIFSSICQIDVREAREGDKIQTGQVLFAPPDYHMSVNAAGRIDLTPGELVKFCRPAVDPLFISLANIYGPACAGIILTGANDDGADGLQAIAEAGGTTVIQDPETAEFFSMPKAAAKQVRADYQLPLDQIVSLLLNSFAL